MVILTLNLIKIKIYIYNNINDKIQRIIKKKS